MNSSNRQEFTTLHWNPTKSNRSNSYGLWNEGKSKPAHSPDSVPSGPERSGGFVRAPIYQQEFKVGRTGRRKPKENSCRGIQEQQSGAASLSISRFHFRRDLRRVRVRAAEHCPFGSPRCWYALCFKEVHFFPSLATLDERDQRLTHYRESISKWRCLSFDFTVYVVLNEGIKYKKLCGGKKG